MPGDPPAAKAPSGTAPQQYQCDATATKPNQLWERISKGGNLYVLRNKATGLFLFRTADGRVIQSHAGGTASTFENPIDVKLLCTGTNYSGGCFGTTRSK